jgi:hypothetical protein
LLGTGYTETGYGSGVTVMVGGERGAYPCANSILVRGTAETLVIDPSLALVGAAPPADVDMDTHTVQRAIGGASSR